MAGAGKKTFVAGEVLTAAQVNDYLMDQAVMRFSGSAARAASITAPTEGMITYLDDQNRLEFYDGSAWQQVVPQDQINGKIAASLVSASGDLIVAIGSGSVVRLPVGSNGTYLQADTTASTGVSWKTVSAGGEATYLQIAATGVTALPQTLSAGFYRIQTSTTTTWTDQQWRFVDTKGQLFGANITGGAGFFTIPVSVASLNITTGTTPFNVLIEEVQGVSSGLIAAPSVSAFTWTEVYAGSISLTSASNAASLGVFDVISGKFNNLGAAASTKTGASIVSAGASLSNSYDVVLVQSDPFGVWSTASVTASTRYPFAIYTGNGTYTPPPWSPNADVLVVAGGGGGRFGGGGAGGVTRGFAIPTPASVSVTVGAGGAGGANGSNSSFGPTSATGGGYGASDAHPATPAGAASPGGSGGGGAGNNTAGTGSGTQGFPGGTGRIITGPIGTTVWSAGGGGVSASGTSHLPTTSPANQPIPGGSGSVVYGLYVAQGGQGQVPTSTVSIGGGGPYGSVSGSLGIVVVKANT